jgi:hypothetical protein
MGAARLASGVAEPAHASRERRVTRVHPPGLASERGRGRGGAKGQT